MSRATRRALAPAACCRRPRRLAWLACALLCSTFARTARAEGESNVAALRPPVRPVPQVVILRRAGLHAYEVVAEEFRNQVRAAVTALPVRRANYRSLIRWLQQSQPNLVFVIGQSAYQLIAEEPLLPPLLHSFVYYGAKPQHIGVSPQVPVTQVLQAFRAARPSLRTVAALCGPRSCGETLPLARDAARRLGLRLIELRAKNPAEAIGLLRRMGTTTDGLWLVPDIDILTAQVVQYSVGLQFRRRIPLLGATRRHVALGALMALDYDTHRVAQTAAELANRFLTRHARRAPLSRGLLVSEMVGKGQQLHRFSINLGTATRIGANVSALRQRASEVVK